MPPVMKVSRLIHSDSYRTGLEGYIRTWWCPSLAKTDLTATRTDKRVSEASTFMRQQFPNLRTYQLTTNNLRHDRVPLKNETYISFYRNNILHVAIHIINYGIFNCVLFSLQYIIHVIKPRIMRLAEHVACMGESRDAYIVLVGKSEGKSPHGRQV